MVNSMALNLTSPVTGSAQTGFTAPTYTLTADVAPGPNGKQWAVTAVGGTQAGVTAHSVSNPFTVSLFRPLVLKVLPFFSSSSLLKNIPVNTYTVLVRRGLIPASGQPAKVAPCRCEIPVPAGADAYDIANVRAMISLMIGTLTQLSAELGNTASSGSI